MILAFNTITNAFLSRPVGRHFRGVIGILLILITTLLPAFAQTEVSYRRGATQLEDILPPSPEAASRVKYADVPFTHSTGAAEYSVPIYELKGRRLTIPISLDYCSNGIKMDEIAGVAGLGWTLNAGGCITREVVYMPDEFEDGMFHYTWPDSNLQSELLAHTSNISTLAFLTDVAWNRIDTNSDRYSYNVMGLKGLFIIDPDGNVIQLQGDGVEISYDFVTVNGIVEKVFTILGPDGTVYTFANHEKATRKDQYREPTYSSGQQVDWSATTAWYLTQMTSRDGMESATFTYADGGTWDRSTISVSQVLTASPSTSTSGFEENVSYDYSTVKSEHETTVLTGISLSGFTASIQYSSVTSHSLHTVSSGTDADNYPQRLTSITVTNPSGVELVRAETATAAHNHDGRILLNGINVYRSGTLDDRWTFSYNTTTHTVSRYSQDWFGYFNGENGDWINHPPLVSGAGRTNLRPYLLVPSPNYVANLTYGAPYGVEARYMMLKEANHDGARTTWDYEAGTTGSTISVNGTTVPVNVGVRVSRIKVYNGNTLVRVRSFSYGSPSANTWIYPIQEMYIRTSARIVQTGSNILPQTGTSWTFTLYETPVTDGLSLQSARVWYGSVTEEVSESENTVGNKTVYTYDTSPILNLSYNTLGRFPSNWENIYEGAAVGIAPFSGVQSQYYYDGATDPARLIRKETYRRNPATGSSELVEKEETSYSTFTTSSLLTGYKAVRVMQPLIEGPVYEQDFQHYPIFSQRRLGFAPSNVTRVGYHASGNDTTKVYYGATRSSFSIPARNTTVMITSSDAMRTAQMTYPDTWGSGAPAWVTALASAHALSEPIKRQYITASTTADIVNPRSISLRMAEPIVPLIPPGAKRDTISVVTEYDTFNGHLMPARTIESVNGTESWREEILNRDILGNPASIKEKGRPVTSVVWGYNGLFPVAVAEGASYSSLLTAMGGQTYVNTLTQSTTLSSSQQTKLNSLRTASQTASSHVTTMTHSPGIGVLSTTDAAGIKTSYTYDNGGRLASVVNTQGQTTHEYSYNLLNSGNNLLSATHYTYTDFGKSSSYRDVSWWNALGLKLEDIAVAASGTGNYDLVTAYESDYMLHDDVHTWLPYPASSGTAGSFRSNAASASASHHGSTAAYSGRIYEESSRDRVLKTTLPGYAAHPNELSTDIVTGFPMLLWRHSTIENNGVYTTGHLVAEKTEDADGRISYSVKDHHGRLLATKREGAGTGWDASTRYVYDELDRLAMVIGAGISVTDTLSMWRYGYDELGRLCSKGVPGSVREYYTYDNEDRVITVTRGDEFTEISYDSFGRVTAKYITIGSGSRTQIETHQYDSYSSAATTLIGGSSYTSGPKKGLETWSSLAVTDGQGGFSGTATTAYAYDALGRLTRSVTQYADGHKNTTVISYNFAGNPTSSVVTGVRPGGGTTDVLSVTTTYDSRERPVSAVSVLTIGGVEKARNTTNYSYDELGRQSAISSGPTSTADLLESQYGYTLQQWTSSISIALGGRTVFSETLGYDSPYNSLGGPSYTGLITRKGETWTIPTGPSPSQIQSVSRTEDYVYDYAARLSGWDDSSNGENISYDARGNITLRSPRYGSGGSITQTYSGDRLATRKVGTAAAVSFAHDSFARMTTDAEAGLSITYNAFNLTETISSGNTLKAKYTYLADGTKVSALDASGAGLVYRGPFTYRRSSGGTLTFESAPFDRGRLTEAGVRYHVTDHLGSVRAVINGKASTTTYPLAGFYSVNDFAPFGTKSTSSASSYLSLASTGSTVSLRDGFTGQEDQGPDFGVGYSDFGARQYSPILSRWLVPDPMGEKYYDVSPYAYCAGNPVNLVDPNGEIWLTPQLAESLKQETQNRIDDLNTQIGLYSEQMKEFGAESKEYQNLQLLFHDAQTEVALLNQALLDIDRLGDDTEHFYTLMTDKFFFGEEHHVQQYKGGRIGIESSSNAFALHEIRHVVQSLDAGGLIFENGLLRNAAGNNPYDKTIYKTPEEFYNAFSHNEIEAYQVQFSMDHSFPGHGVQFVSDISVHTVGTIHYPNGTPVYKHIKYLSDALLLRAQLSNTNP